MSTTFATTFASPVRPSFDAPGSVMAPPSPARHSSRPSSTKSTRSSSKRTTPTAARTTAARAPPLPVPARSSSMVKPTAETAPRALDPLFQLPFGAPLPNMYESSASLSPSEEDDSDSDAGPTPTRREMRSRTRREGRNKEVSTTPTTASSSGSSLRKSVKSTKERSAAAERKSPSSKRPSSTKKASLPRAAGHQGLGVEIEGVGWEHTMRAGEDARRYEDAAFQQPPITSATYTSDLGSGISAQGSSPEVTQLGHAPTPLHAHAPPPMPTPPSPSRSRSSRSRHGSIHSNGEVKASRGAPRFLSEQVDNHEHESAYPSVELHPEHIVFATPATTTSKAPSRRSSTASNLRTPSLIHSPASVSQAYPETPALPSPSTYAHRDQQPHRRKSVSSIGSSRSHASSQAYSAGQPTPSAARYATSNAYFPPPPPPKSPRRYASPVEENLGATPIPQVFPSTRPRQSSSSRTPSGPFPGPPTSSPHARSQRSPAPSSTSVFPSAPRSSASTSPATSRQSEVFPSVRQPSSCSTAPATRPVSSAPWEEGSGEDELDWMVSAQRKLDPSLRSPRSARSTGGVRQVFASRRVEQPRSLEEQRAYEREEGGLGYEFESVADFESMRAVDIAWLDPRGEKAEAEVLHDPTPVKVPSRRTASEDEPPRTQHQHHSKRYSQSSATSGASEYASAAEHDGEDEGAEEASLSDSPTPSAPEVAVFPATTTTNLAPPSAANADQTGLWVLDNIVNTVVNGSVRRMSAIGEVSENEAPSGRDSAQASGGDEERQGFDAGRLNTKKLSLTPAELLEPITGGKSGETTPVAGTPTRAELRSSSLPPPQDPQVSTYPFALSPASLRSPYSPNTTTPARPTFQRSSSANSRASLYNHSNASSLSAQTQLSGHSSHRSTPASNRTKGSKFTKKLGAFFGGGGGSTGDRGVPPQPQGISSEQVRAWAAGGGGEDEEERKEVLQDDLMMERKAASTSTGGTDEVVLLSSSEASGKKEEVVHFESLLEKFQREERERLVELKASKWAQAAQAAGSVEAQETRVEPIV